MANLKRRRLVQGVGINDADYVVRPTIDGKIVKCPFYTTWRDMLKRCYSVKYQKTRPSYIRCSVSKDWLTFSNFRKWMMTQDWEDKNLDKDILVQGNKVYSANKCLFVTPAINSLFIDHKESRGKYPIGVTWFKAQNRFKAQCSTNSKNKHLGLFNTPQEAHEAYKTFKYALIKKAARQQNEPLRSAMLSYSIT